MGRWCVGAVVAVLTLGGCLSVDRADPDPQCVPECSGLECGDDGCGGSCGACPNAAPYCVSGACEVTCTPDCAGSVCGDDGCGGSCGACDAGQTCSSGVCEASAPCLEVSPESVDFGKLAGRDQSTKTVDLTACGDAPVTIRSLTLDPAGSTVFGLDLSGFGGLPDGTTSLQPGGQGVVLPAGTTASVSVTADAGQRSRFSETAIATSAILLESDAVPAERTVPLEARFDTGPPPGPIAHIDVAEGTEVLLGTELHLDATGSTGAGGISAWQWEAQGPGGAEGTFEPSASVATPSLTVDTAGQWTLQLQVTAKTGGDTDTASVAVEVFVATDLSVRLEWDAPGDEEPGDIFGANVNLHLVHEDAGGGDSNGDGLLDGWFHLALACWEENPSPDWGAMGDFDDDPVWTDSDAQEEVYLEEPEVGATYRVGVHYAGDDGFDPVGEVFATVRIYAGETLLLERPNIGLDLHDFWEVGAVTYPSSDTEVYGSGGPRIVPNVLPDLFQFP